METCNSSASRECEAYSFDNLGRPETLTRSLGGYGLAGQYSTAMDYDVNGRLLREYDVVMDVSMESGIYYHYNEYGYNSGLHTRGQALVPGQGQALTGAVRSLPPSLRSSGQSAAQRHPA